MFGEVTQSSDLFSSFTFQNYQEIVETLAQYFPFFALKERLKGAAIAFTLHNNALARVGFINYPAFRVLVYNVYNENNFPRQG